MPGSRGYHCKLWKVSVGFMSPVTVLRDPLTRLHYLLDRMTICYEDNP